MMHSRVLSGCPMNFGVEASQARLRYEVPQRWPREAFSQPLKPVGSVPIFPQAKKIDIEGHFHLSAFLRIPKSNSGFEAFHGVCVTQDGGQPQGGVALVVPPAPKPGRRCGVDLFAPAPPKAASCLRHSTAATLALLFFSVV